MPSIFKYAEATEVKIEIVATNDSINLRVEDNGKGFNFNEKITGFGIQGMRERVAALESDFHLPSLIVVVG